MDRGIGNRQHRLYANKNSATTTIYTKDGESFRAREPDVLRELTNPVVGTFPAQPGTYLLHLIEDEELGGSACKKSSATQ